MEQEADRLQSHIIREIGQHGVGAVITALVNAFDFEASRSKPESHEHRRFKRLAQKARAMHDE